MIPFLFRLEMLSASNFLRAWTHQLERAPTTGGLHLQGCLQLHKETTMSRLQGVFLLPIHFEEAKCERGAWSYGFKPETKVDGPWEWGTFLFQGQSAGIAEMAAMLRTHPVAAVASAHPETFIQHSAGAMRFSLMCGPVPPLFRLDKECIVFWGPTGTGKTRTAIEWDEHAYMPPLQHGGSLWFDGYEGEKTAIFDEFKGQIPLDTFLRLIDVYRCKVPVKQSHAWWNPCTILITSNFSPDDWYDWTGRHEQREAMWRRFTRGVWYLTKDQTTLTKPGYPHFVPANDFYRGRV